MEGSDLGFLDGILSLISWWLTAIASALSKFWRDLVELQSRYPQLLSFQTVFGLSGWLLGIWKWWEGREVNLFRRFERMIQGQEAQLVKARSDLLEVMTRPGPGLLIRAPVFAERPLKAILTRKRWYRSFVSVPLAGRIDRRLESAIRTCDRKVTAHASRLKFFREQIASARLLQGALAAGQAAHAPEVHESQRLDQEALDHFRAVLDLPNHKKDSTALELIAHQLSRLDGQNQLAANAYRSVIEEVVQQPESAGRNRVLARAKRGWQSFATEMHLSLQKTCSKNPQSC